MRCHTLMLLLFCVLPLPTTALAQAPEPIVYTLAMPAPAEHTAVVTASVPTGGRPAIELFMARWSPGFYRIENYSQQVVEFTARSKGGEELGVEHPSDNHWRIATSGAAQVVATYTLRCQRASVTGNQVETGFAVFCGPATFVDLEGGAANPREVQLLLPADWPHSATGLAKAKDGKPHHYTAPDYDWLADSPIVAGTIRTDRFDVLGSHHEIASFGNVGAWDGALAAQKLQPIATELCRLFGTVPFEHYVFLNGLRAANGGLEHLNSTLISTDPRQHPDDLQWLAFVAHEYCHTFNVKRLRPVELGPFDYEKPPTTASLWIAEGLTTYFADLALARAGIATAPQWLALMSAHIRQLQSTAGRKQQTLADAS